MLMFMASIRNFEQDLCWKFDLSRFPESWCCQLCSTPAQQVEEISVRFSLPALLLSFIRQEMLTSHRSDGPYQGFWVRDVHNKWYFRGLSAAHLWMQLCLRMRADMHAPVPQSHPERRHFAVMDHSYPILPSSQLHDHAVKRSSSWS